MINDIRQNPTAEFIADIRQRYPVETELDTAYTRKMNKRSQGEYKKYSLDKTEKQLTQCLSGLFGSDVFITDLSRLAGGASQEQYSFSIKIKKNSSHLTEKKLVLRREPNESICAADRLREYQLMKAANKCLPVPKPYFVDREGEVFGRPALISEFANGVQKPSLSTGNVTGIGVNFPRSLREKLAPQFVKILASIHTIDLNANDFSAFTVPEIETTNGTELLINSLARVWNEDYIEQVPLLSVAELWLRRNKPPLDHVSVVHGDYRSGNFLFDEASAQITAILDWELGFMGDRHADLAWALFEPFGSRGENGEFLCCGLMERDEFIAAYEDASGLPVDPIRLKYYTVLNLWRAILLSLASGPRAANGAKTHQDIVLTWVAGVAYPLLETMRVILEEEISNGP